MLNHCTKLVSEMKVKVSVKWSPHYHAYPFPLTGFSASNFNGANEVYFVKGSERIPCQVTDYSSSTTRIVCVTGWVCVCVGGWVCPLTFCMLHVPCIV